MGSIFGWIGLEFIVIGVNISKSAIASYGEMIGIILPFVFDMTALGRKFVLTDLIGLILIVLLQILRAFNSFKESEKTKTVEKQKLLASQNKDADNEKLYKN
jgi:hypothetical protein